MFSGKVPEHIGIIMDGNGRWAAAKGLPRTAGHTAGAKAFRTIAEYCNKIGVKALTVYAFSTENWKRSSVEIEGIMKLLGNYLTGTMKDGSDGIRLRFIGRKERLSEDILAMIEKVEKSTEACTGLCLYIALDYGGRDEIVSAARKLAQMAVSGEISPEDITEDSFSDNIFTADHPEADLIIRPSGEQRLSNFLLWQCAYSEFIFMDKLWPDFTPEDLDKAIDEFNSRNRRFGA